MKKTSVLLVDNPYFNISKIDDALNEAGMNYSLYFAGSGKNGLDILMGDPYQDIIASESIKIKPQVVILSKELKDMPATEFLRIVSNYYSLREVKFFLLFDSLTDEEQFVYEELGVSGYLQRPLNKEQVTNEILSRLNGGRPHAAFMPVIPGVKTGKIKLGFLIKTKLASLGAGVKIAACFASVVVITTAASHHMNKKSRNNSTSHVVKTEENRDETFSKETLPLLTEEAISTKTIPEKQTAPKRSKPIPVSEPIPSHLDSTKLPEAEHTGTISNKPRNLHIMVIEEPDSTHNPLPLPGK